MYCLLGSIIVDDTATKTFVTIPCHNDGSAAGFTVYFGLKPVHSCTSHPQYHCAYIGIKKCSKEVKVNRNCFRVETM